MESAFPVNVHIMYTLIPNSEDGDLIRGTKIVDIYNNVLSVGDGILRYSIE
jgi:hypothetical protein